MRSKKSSKPQVYVSRSIKETLRVGERLAQELFPGSVVALDGDLGSGKTTLIKGIACGLGLKDPDEVKSPTFALMHVYAAHVPVYHFDLYRLESAKEIEALGFEEFVTDPGAVVLIEWAEKAKTLLPAKVRRVRMSVLGAKRRRIEIL